MIEGTKQFRGGVSTAKKSESSTTEALSPPADPRPPVAPRPATSAPDALNQGAAEGTLSEHGQDRRRWFRSLVPALGEGLVEILRAGNHLRHDLELLKKAPPSSQR